MQLHISKIHISNFLGESDLNWNLNQINVLVGQNGSGKSTLLKLIQSTIENNLIEESWLCNACNISFNEEIESSSYFIGIKESPLSKLDINDEDVIDQIIKKLEISNPLINKGNSFNLVEMFVDKDAKKKLAKEILSTVVSESKNKVEVLNGPFSIEKNRKLDRIFHTKFSTEIREKHPELFINKKDKLNLNVEFFSTVNMNANSINKVNLSDGKTSTILDIEIHEEINTIRNHSKSKILKEKLVRTLNIFFKETNKIVKFDNNLIIEKSCGEVLKLKDLSSGERQIIYIFLKVVNASVKKSILLMDEPEISLHMSWQEKLIGEILEINPNQQIIIVTHSPAIVMNGWMDSYKDIKEILIPYEQ
ncbi:AAA family ATPase [Acinetobacter sp. TSRC1-2]|uniref:AAA family ATPase n=1 Tax=unclassified Acinetobacter TaxID=196816 RepID=UPI003CEF7A91